MGILARERVLKLRGGQVRYAVFGRGARTLVMIPGLSLRRLRGSGAALALQYRCFARHWRVYVFEPREEVPEGWTAEDLAEDLAAAMAQLGLRGADVLGVSQGGLVAQHLALRHPELVRRMVLAVTLCRPNPTVRAVIGRWVALAESGDQSGLVRDCLETLYSPAYLRKNRALVALAARVTKPDRPERFIPLARACLTGDCYEALPALRCPVLVLGGEEDRVVTAEASREIARQLHCPLRLYPGLGHAAYEEAPDFNATVMDFFTG